MVGGIKALIKELQSYPSVPGVFNPWRDYDRECDAGPGAPGVRSAQLEQFLRDRLPYAKYLFVAEAISYQGGKFTGITMTSERILLGYHATVGPEVVLPHTRATRTSNPHSNQLNNTQKQFGFTEPTATVMWNAVIAGRISPLEVITWNTFPFHPHRPDKGSLNNRTPKRSELEHGRRYIKMLLALLPDAHVVAVGRCSARTLDNMGIANTPVRHPANGGAAIFTAAVKDILTER